MTVSTKSSATEVKTATDREDNTEVVADEEVIVVVDAEVSVAVVMGEVVVVVDKIKEDAAPTPMLSRSCST